MRDGIAFNLGQDGIKRSSEESAFYPNALDCRCFLRAPCILGQRLLPGGHVMATALVQNGGIKLGHLCGSERRGTMSRRWSTVPHFGDGLELGQRRYRQRCSVFGRPSSLVGLVCQHFLCHRRSAFS
jgi:hypothetical protein